MAANQRTSFTITGVKATIANLTRMNSRVMKKITPEVNEIGRTMLGDVRAVTPVVSGRLKQSAYYSEGESDPTIVSGSVGYTAPYAPDIEFRHGMLGDTLHEWNEQIRKKIIDAGYQAL